MSAGWCRGWGFAPSCTDWRFGMGWRGGYEMPRGAWRSGSRGGRGPSTRSRMGCSPKRRPWPGSTASRPKGAKRGDSTASSFGRVGMSPTVASPFHPTPPFAPPAKPSCSTPPIAAIAIPSLPVPTAAPGSRSSAPCPTIGRAPACPCSHSVQRAGRSMRRRATDAITPRPIAAPSAGPGCGSSDPEPKGRRRPRRLRPRRGRWRKGKSSPSAAWAGSISRSTPPTTWPYSACGRASIARQSPSP